MAQITQITLDPLDTISVGAKLGILYVDEISDLKQQVNLEFVEKRFKVNQVTLGVNLQETLINLGNTLRLDYPNDTSSNLVSPTRIRIDIVNPNLQVIDVISFDPIRQGPIFNDSIVVLPHNPFEITSITFSQSNLNFCERVKVKVVTNQNMTSYCVNSVCNLININTHEFEVERGAIIDFRAIRNDVTKSQIIYAPVIINDINVSVTNSPQGATAYITIQNNLIGLELQYSLDNVNWQIENVFSGLEEGAYKVYVKDQLGCSKSKEFHVLENNFESRPVVFISKENSIRFREPNGPFQNDENRLFNESVNQLNYCFYQDFLNSDKITTQFKSNYLEVSAKIYNQETGEVSDLIIIQKTRNIGLKQKLTQVNKYKINEYQFGIYFESGNVLDYDSNSIIESYSFQGSLPIWGKLGNFINIAGVIYQINAIAFDESVNSEVLIFNGTMNGQVEQITVSCIYNFQDYEVYEFEVDFSYFQNSKIRVEITNSDPNFGQYVWSSEILCSNSILERFLEIRYKNSTNTNIIYSTTIEHLLRIPFNTIKAVDADSSENYRTDTSTYLIDSKISEITEFEFMPLPLELYRKLKIALSLDSIFIDDIGYSKNSEFGKEPLGQTNLYKLSAQMIKNGFAKKSLQYGEIIEIENPMLNIPGLIRNEGNGFIEY